MELGGLKRAISGTELCASRDVQGMFDRIAGRLIHELEEKANREIVNIAVDIEDARAMSMPPMLNQQDYEKLRDQMRTPDFYRNYYQQRPVWSSSTVTSYSHTSRVADHWLNGERGKKAKPKTFLDQLKQEHKDFTRRALP